MNTVILTGREIGRYRMMAQLSALKLEILGMKNSKGSVYAAIKREYGFTGSKAVVYEKLTELYQSELSQD